MDQRLDFVMGDRWWTGAGRCGPPLDCVDDQGHGAAGLQHVVHDLSHAWLIGPVERLAEGNRSVRARGRVGKVFGQRLHPSDGDGVGPQGSLATLSEHVGVWVQADGLLEEPGQSECEDAGAAADIKQSPAAVQA